MNEIASSNPSMDRVRAAFNREASEGRLADAYLFVGRSASALREFVFDCARTLLGAQGPLEQHRDFSLFDPEQLGVAGLKVEHVAHRREGVQCLETELRYRPATGERRAVVLLRADRMNLDAQGALLKTAEEPPPGTTLLLTACTLAALTPALRSRCRLWRIPPRDPQALDREAAAAGISDREWALLLAAFGDAEAVLEFASEDRAWLLEEALPQLLVWRDGGAPSWMMAPQGAKLADQRLRGTQMLAAALGLLADGYAEQPPEAAAWRDFWMGNLDRAQAELSGQVTPATVFAALLASAQGVGLE